MYILESLLWVKMRDDISTLGNNTKKNDNLVHMYCIDWGITKIGQNTPA